MTDQIVQITAGSGTKIQTFENTVGGNVVEAQCVSLVDTAGLTVGSTSNPLNVIDPDLTVTATITATDAVVAAPAGAGAFVTGASTAASYVSRTCLGGDSTWNVSVTALTSGSLYFEGSVDSTNGVDGNWMSLHGQRLGILSTVVTNVATANGMYRGNTAGMTYFRVRSVTALTGTPSIKIQISSGPGTVGINTSIPAGTNSIGTTLGPTLTKGTQAATGYSVQNLKDAGRVRVTIGFQSTATATADTLLSLVKTSAGVAAGGATTIAVTSGKTLRITAIGFSIKAGAAAVAFGTMTLRTNPSGAAIITSPSEFRIDVGNTAATTGAAAAITYSIPDGMEYSGTEQIAVSLAAQATTNIVSVMLTGFEY